MGFIRSGGFRKLLVAVVLVAFGAGAGLAFVAFDLLKGLPELASIEDYQPPLTSHVLDRNGAAWCPRVLNLLSPFPASTICRRSVTRRGLPCRMTW